MADKIRIFIGCAPNGDDAEAAAVVEYTLRKHSSLPIDITWMVATADETSPWSGWDMSTWATPFSGFRWAVPEVCGFEGRALYMDSDTIVMTDIAELWNRDIGDKVMAARGTWRFCVALFDCARMKRHVGPLAEVRSQGYHASAISYFRSRPGLVDWFGSYWNWLDSGETMPMGEAGIIHYSDLSSQPSRRHSKERLAAHGRKHWYDGPTRRHRLPKLVELFDRELNEAIEAGFAPANYVPEERYDLRKASMLHYRGA